MNRQNSRTSRSNDFSQEINRIGSFDGWPGHDQHNRPIRPSALVLAEAGFYFTGRSDEVKCFCCEVSIDNWERHNIPLAIHATRSPQCAFVLKHEISNRPVMVPQGKNYAEIVSMLDQIGERVLRTVNGQSYSASALISDTLRKLYGESMMSDSYRNQQINNRLPQCTEYRPQLPPRPSGSMTPPPDTAASQARVMDSKKEQARRLRINSTPSQSTTTSTPQPQTQRLIDSQPEPLSSADRPFMHRARSCANDTVITHQGRLTETIPNRQTSNPGMDLERYQESEEARLATFSKWPGVRGSSAQEFAQAGFIFYGRPDRVMCVFCTGILRNWNDDDIPMEEHRQRFPDCPYVKECQSSALNLAKPRYAKYKTKPARLKSFDKWNPQAVPSGEALAEAGFFFVGESLRYITSYNILIESVFQDLGT